MNNELPQQVQHQLAQLQQIQHQAQVIIGQKTKMELMLRETEQAQEELEKLEKDAVVYKGIGQLLIKSEKTAVTEDLAEKKEVLSVRLKTLEKQEQKIQEKFQQLQNQIRTALGQKEGAGGI